MNIFTVDRKRQLEISEMRRCVGDALPLTADCGGACQCDRCAPRRASRSADRAAGTGLTAAELETVIHNVPKLSTPELERHVLAFKREASLSDRESFFLLRANNELNKRRWPK